MTTAAYHIWFYFKQNCSPQCTVPMSLLVQYQFHLYYIRSGLMDSTTSVIFRQGRNQEVWIQAEDPSTLRWEQTKVEDIYIYIYSSCSHSGRSNQTRSLPMVGAEAIQGLTDCQMNCGLLLGGVTGARHLLSWEQCLRTMSAYSATLENHTMIWHLSCW